MEELNIPENATKETVFELTQAYLHRLALGISSIDNQRPWGGFFVIDKDSTDSFISQYFPELDKADIYKHGSELSPKILLVEPNQILSWQYHNRRAELWKAVIGPVGVKVSLSDTLPDAQEVLATGESVEHDNQVRHRLIGLGNWGVVAEIWQHTVEGNPSDEADIVRVEDSYGRG